MGAPRCSTCRHVAVSQVDALLRSGTPVREVARLTGIPRSNVARHREHVEPSERRLGLVPPGPPEPDRVDPLDEALAILSRATTQRERLRALEAVRSASWLILRQLGGDVDSQLLERLDSNVAAAEAAYRDQRGIESALYGLAGVREAIRQRIVAARGAQGVETVLELIGGKVMGQADSELRSLGFSSTFSESLEVYFAGIPQRYRDVDRFKVRRTIQMAFHPRDAVEEIQVFEVASGGLVWVKDP